MHNSAHLCTLPSANCASAHLPRPTRKRFRATGCTQVLATQRLEALEAEFAAFKKQENPEMGLEEYGMLERSFNQRIQRERDYWDNLDANSIPMRTFPLQVQCLRFCACESVPVLMDERLLVCVFWVALWKDAPSCACACLCAHCI
jgi:hypothetical protein